MSAIPSFSQLPCCRPTRCNWQQGKRENDFSRHAQNPRITTVQGSPLLQYFFDQYFGARLVVRCEEAENDE